MGWALVASSVHYSTDAFAGFCGQLGVGWVILAAADPQAKGMLERSHRFMRSNFEPGRRFANEADFQLQLDEWSDKVNQRVHRSVRAVPADTACARPDTSSCRTWGP